MSQRDEYEITKRALDRLDPYEQNAIIHVMLQGLVVMGFVCFIVGALVMAVIHALR